MALYDKKESVTITRSAEQQGYGTMVSFNDIYTIQYKDFVMAMSQDDAMKLAESIKAMYADQIHGDESITWHPNKEIKIETGA